MLADSPRGGDFWGSPSSGETLLAWAGGSRLADGALNDVASGILLGTTAVADTLVMSHRTKVS